MLKRKAMAEFEAWKRRKTKQALLVDGMRQVGKTYLVRAFARANYEHLAEINFLDNKAAARAISTSMNAEELFIRLSAFIEGELVPHTTLIFLDEIQECDEVVTAIKFLVDGHPEYDYVLSGSLLGTELKNVRSVPVGYLDSVTMYPLDFEEYCWARGVVDSVIGTARTAYLRGEAVDEFVHGRLLSTFHEYLVVGGMPAAVDAFVRERTIPAARAFQQNIIARLREDIAKYASDRARVIKRIFDLIPSELSRQNKRFIISHVEGDSHFDRYENDFLWLADAGVALPTYNVLEPQFPLTMAEDANLFKLFLGDVGLLASMVGMDAVREVLGGRADVNFGSFYESFVAQELTAHGYPLFYYQAHRAGELDFLIEGDDMRVVPIEVKSGRYYRSHAALDRALAAPNYGIEGALVLCEDNVSTEANIRYAPVYCAAFLERNR